MWFNEKQIQCMVFEIIVYIFSFIALILDCKYTNLIYITVVYSLKRDQVQCLLKTLGKWFCLCKVFIVWCNIFCIVRSKKGYMMWDTGILHRYLTSHMPVTHVQLYEKIKNQGWTQVLRKGKQFLLHIWHPSCYSCYKPVDKSWIRKGPNCDYDYLLLKMLNLLFLNFIHTGKII